VSFDIANSPSLPGWARERLLERIGPRTSAVAQEARSQLRNRALARERLAKRLAVGLQRPKERRPTRPGAAARERRLEAKRHTAQRKQMRQPPSEE
jgi:ribosome-associated protein